MRVYLFIRKSLIAFQIKKEDFTLSRKIEYQKELSLSTKTHYDTIHVTFHKTQNSAEQSDK